MKSRTKAIGRSVVALSVIVVILVALLTLNTFSPFFGLNTATIVSTTTATLTDTSASTETQTVISQVNYTNVSTITQTTTATSTETTTIIATSTETTVTTSDTSFAYLATGICTVGSSYGPCWGTPIYTFNCFNAATTAQGCTKNVTSTLAPYPSYTINIRYPLNNQSAEPTWSNCLWALQGSTPDREYAYCSIVNATAFIMGEPTVNGHE